MIDARVQEQLDALLGAKDFDAAQALVMPYLYDDPCDTDALLFTGIIQTESGDQEAAEKTLAWYFNLGGQAAEAQEAMGCCLLRQDKFDESEPYLEMARTAMPAVSSVHRNIAVLYHQTGRERQAYECLQQAVLCNPDDVLALTALLPVLVNLHHYEEARRVGEKVLGLNPSPELHNYAASLLKRLGQEPND
jgi:tetratricopeptide (TPR) repeat protein